MRETNFDVVKSFISLNVIQPRQIFSVSVLIKFYVGNQEKTYRGRLKEKVIQEGVPRKANVYSTKLSLRETVSCLQRY